MKSSLNFSAKFFIQYCLFFVFFQMSRQTPILSGIPSEVQDQVKCLLAISPELRPDTHQISKVCQISNFPQEFSGRR